MATQGKITVRLGRLFWGNARKAAEAINFKGGDLQCFESSGVLDRDFTFKGSTPSILILKQHFDALIEENDKIDAGAVSTPKASKGILPAFLRRGKN